MTAALRVVLDTNVVLSGLVLVVVSRGVCAVHGKPV